MREIPSYEERVRLLLEQADAALREHDAHQVRMIKMLTRQLATHHQVSKAMTTAYRVLWERTQRLEEQLGIVRPTRTPSRVTAECAEELVAVS